MASRSRSEVSEGRPFGCQSSAELWLLSPGPVLSIGFVGDKKSEHLAQKWVVLSVAGPLRTMSTGLLP